MISSKSPSQSLRKPASQILIILGLLQILSGLVIHPFIGKFWRHAAIDVYSSGMQLYSLWALSIGIFTIALAYFINKSGNRRWAGWIMLFLISSSIVLVDRLLLAKIGQSIWVADVKRGSHYRPNAIKSWGPSFNNKRIYTNSFGHHDNKLNIKKSDNQFRILVLGDSIAMGYGVTRSELFSNQLENLLDNVEVINTGVSGYGTQQEWETLKSSLMFAPDHIIVAFCMNDVVRSQGSMPVLNSLLGFASNNTGFGQWIYKRQSQKKAIGEAGNEAEDVRRMAALKTIEGEFVDDWKFALEHLEKMYTLAKNKEIPITLLILPHTFQINNTQLQNPQKILTQHAKENGIKVLDLTSQFASIIKDDSKNSEYFLDFDHYTVKGNQFVATILKDYFKSSFSQ